MKSTRFEPQEVRRTFEDRALLVGTYGMSGSWGLEEDLAELGRLAETAGARIVATVTQRLEKPNPRTFIGAGKLEEIAETARRTKANLVIFDDDLTPGQQGNIEALLPGVKVIDRTALILDIFALHAHTREGKLQVELAQMEYLLPRLRGLWRHLERLGGGGMGAMGTGGVGTRGPGETQLETDRRLARRRIDALRRELKQVSASRDLRRKARAERGVFRVALVGYTNAGKSTLLRELTGADVLVEDQLFATLDSTTRQLQLPGGRSVTLTDTVGFINKLPHGLVEAFKSTLDEVREADILLHVIDASHPQRSEQMAAVREVLGEIGASSKPQLNVYNKIDLLDEATLKGLRSRHPSAVFVSARKGMGLDDLKDRLAEEAARRSRTLDLLVPYDRGDIVTMAHESAQVVSETHEETGTHLVVRSPQSMLDVFEPFENGHQAAGEGRDDASGEETPEQD